jgi:glucosamine-6-phosphate deaminase
MRLCKYYIIRTIIFQGSKNKKMTEKKSLYEWCRIKAGDLENHPGLKVKFRMAENSEQMGELMAKELAGEIKLAASEGRQFRVIIPCGPKCWYAPYTKIINDEKISLRHVTVFHMDECLDWEGNLLAANDPYNFRTFMDKYFYGGITAEELNVPPDNRIYLTPDSMAYVREKIWEAPIDLTLGGWGQDGHVAYNQARRHPFSRITLDELRNSSVRIQENNTDTILALAHRTLGAAYQFAPPMSVTLGIKECLSAKKIRLFSDTGAWKQTALRVALFSEPDTEYPMTLLQEHADAVITATRETAAHPISENPGWEFAGI